jgi:serine/threonine-protein kinase
MPLEKLGPYDIEKLLGRGGMGAVYAGRNRETGQRAAVKVLPSHLADDEAFRERFKQEIETLKRLLHPNIVQLFGYGEEVGQLYYVMELVEGRSVQDELAAGRRFTWREVARTGVAVAQALKHAHDRGIIHRDLKPANLLIDAQDHVKLTDFGIAKLYGGTNVTAEGGVIGTADYMAPEQAEGKPITGRCDLYALGSVLYALLAGKPPFGGRTIIEVIAALKNEQPTPVRRLAPDTPLEFERIIQQLLEKDPQKRIPTPLALANRLRAMEHALSLETRIGLPEEEEKDDEPRAAPQSPQETLGKTSPIRLASSGTKPLQDDDEYRLAAEAPTDVAGESSKRSKTALGTQSGAKTGAASDGKHDTDAKAVVAQAAKEPTTAPAAVGRFTTVTEAELRGRRLAEETNWKQWLVAGGLLILFVAIMGGVGFSVTRAPSADHLYATIKQAGDAGGGEELVPVEGEISRFLELYPLDSRTEEVRGYGEELERFRLQKRFESRARRPEGLLGLAPVERAYLEAVQLAATDPEAALAKYEALVAVFEGPPDKTLNAVQQRTSQQCIELARQQIERLRASIQKLNAEQRAAIRRQLERAENLSATDHAAAEKIWRGIITLYGEKGWAQELVEQARAKVAKE